jgi:outer membrane lipoprotein-sorting protein
VSDQSFSPLSAPRGRSALLRAACVASVSVFLVAAPSPATDLESVLRHFDDVQRSIHTLSAEFEETTSNRLLKEPMVAEGRFYLTKPDSVRWEYQRPEEMRFVISRDQYVGYFPERKRAERRNIRRWRERIFRLVGLGQASDELRKFYDIRLEGSPEDEPGTYLLVFEPRKRRVRKRVDSVRFWVDDSSYLPRRVEYRGSEGTLRTIRFLSISVNPDLSAALYDVDLPDDVEITTGFGGLPGLGEDAR